MNINNIEHGEIDNDEIEKQLKTEPKEFENRDIFISKDTNGNQTIINTRLFSNELIKKYHFKTILENDKILFTLYYDNGYYHNGAISLIKRISEETFPDIVNNRKISEIIGHVSRSTQTNLETININPKILNLKNGLLNIETGEFSKHTPKNIITVRIPVKYDPKAECPEIKKFLKETLNKEDIDLIWEINGYCLYRRYFIKKGFLFNGGGDNGKGIVLGLLRIFLGKGNYSALSLHRLSNSSDRFSSAFLLDMMANIYGDLSSEALKDTGMFKMLTGGDPIPAEIKGGGIFNFINFAKLIFSANKIPDSNDITDAFMDRWIIIDFPYKFVNNPKEKNEKQRINEEPLLNKLTTEEELSGLLNLALEGLKRLINKGDFSYNVTSEENRDRYKRRSNTIYSFKMDWCEVDSEGIIAKLDIYNIYNKYCRDNKLPAEPMIKFGKELQKIIPLIEVHPYSDEVEKQVEAWKGIKIKDNIKEILVNDMGSIGSIGTFSLLWAINGNIYKDKYKQKPPITPISPISGKVEEINIDKCRKCGELALLTNELCKECLEEETEAKRSKEGLLTEPPEVEKPEEQVEVKVELEDIPEPEKTPEQIEEEEREDNEFKKGIEESDGVVDEQLSENGRHISDLREKYEEYYGENKGGDEE